MNIYHLSRQEQIKREENSALVVIAATERAARQLAAELCGAEGEEPWLKRAAVDLLGTAIPSVDARTFACIDCLEA